MNEHPLRMARPDRRTAPLRTDNAARRRGEQLLATLLLGMAGIAAAADKPDLTRLYGRVQFVQSFPDYKVKVVQSFADLHVQMVESFPDAPGKWQVVESFPDFKIQLVESFPDFTIHYVESFPGPQ